MNTNKENSRDEILEYKYRFIFNDKNERVVEVKLEERSLNLIIPQKNFYPEWTELKFFKCANCPLEETQHKLCPTAVAISELVETFKDALSTDEVNVIVEAFPRTYMKQTTLQYGISSLIGIYMPTSGCPILEKLKPMVRYHLPFATIEETLYRMLSTYLVAQYFLYKQGKAPDWDLKSLFEIYEEIGVVNKSFCERLSNIKIKDASLNAVVILDVFASYMKFSLDGEFLEKINPLFTPYFK